MTPAARVMRPFLVRERGALVAAGVSTLVVTLAELARPWPLALVVDHILGGHEGAFTLSSHEVRLLAFVVGLVVAIALADAIAQYVADLRLQQAGERITHELRVAVYAHLQRLSLGFHAKRQKGDLVTRVTGDVNTIGQLFSQSLGSIAQDGLLLVGMLVVVIWLDPLVALAAFAMAPVLATVSVMYRRRLREQARMRRREEGRIASLAGEALNAMPVVKALGGEGHEHARVRTRSAERMAIGVRLARLQARFDGVVSLINALGLSLVLVVGVVRASAGALTAGDLVVLVSYARKAYSPLRSIAKEAVKIASAMASAERIAEVLGADEILEERPGAHRGGRARGDVELQDLSFAYDPERPALRGVSLRVPAGRCVAIMGESGAGKTTVGALVARFYDPGGGRVLLDGRDLRDCSPAWLREQVGVLLQEAVLFTGTVEENIVYGAEANPEEVRAAAAAAAADEFISSLPDGYGAPLGPQGIGLSGGQRQRIGIARTLLRDPPVLVLDEPTTGLDAESQERVVQGLRTLMRGRTTLLITHSPTLAREADHVVVMDDGRIVREGTPDELLGDRDGVPAAARVAGRRSADAALPQRDAMLDPEVARKALARTLPDGAEPDDVAIDRVVYNPGELIAVHYRVGLDGARHDAVATAMAGVDLIARLERPRYAAMARAAAERAPAPRAVTYDAELDAVVSWLPFDPRLPALAVPGDRLARLLRAAGVALEEAPAEPVRLGYKPRGRAVLRFDGHVLKAYGRERQFGAAVTGLRAAGATGVPTAGLEAALEDLRLTVQPVLGGATPRRAADVAREAGALLRDLQEEGVSRLEPLPAERHLAAAERKSAVVTAVLPELGPRLDALLDRLRQTLPEDATLVPAHGDFHVDQLLRTGERLAVVDFDGMCLADPALDLATYAADAVRGRDDDAERVAAVEGPLLDGYGGCPPAYRWYLTASILGRVAHPFQRQLDNWPLRIAGTTAAAEASVVHKG